MSSRGDNNVLDDVNVSSIKTANYTSVYLIYAVELFNRVNTEVTKAKLLVWQCYNDRFTDLFQRSRKSSETSIKICRKNLRKFFFSKEVVYSELNEYHLILSGLFSYFKTPTIINKLLCSLVYYVGSFKIRK